VTAPAPLQADPELRNPQDEVAAPGKADWECSGCGLRLAVPSCLVMAQAALTKADAAEGLREVADHLVAAPRRPPRPAGPRRWRRRSRSRRWLWPAPTHRSRLAPAPARRCTVGRCPPRRQAVVGAVAVYQAALLGEPLGGGVDGRLHARPPTIQASLGEHGASPPSRERRGRPRQTPTRTRQRPELPPYGRLAANAQKVGVRSRPRAAAAMLSKLASTPGQFSAGVGWRGQRRRARRGRGPGMQARGRRRPGGRCG
jgi:hypothetical protein